MKRMLMKLLACVLACFSMGSCIAEDGGGMMYVVNCDEWVSLRQSPSTSAGRLAQVPLGAVVYDCTTVMDSEFIYCSYNGMRGYILGEYLSFAQPGASGEFLGSMTVANCEDWVSLRKSPSKSADRLAKVPLGATVLNCVLFNHEFIKCEYNGMMGYILSDYLLGAFGSESMPVVPAGELILRHSFDGYTISAYHDYGADAEILQINCVDGSGNVCWQYTDRAFEPAQLDKMSAFIGGTPAMPAVMAYNSDVGLRALDFYTGKELWLLSSKEVSLGGSIYTATGYDGTMYVTGYFGPHPVAISSEGRVLWQSSISDDIYWPCGIVVTEEGVVVSYDCFYTHEIPGKVCLGFDGRILWEQQG